MSAWVVAREHINVIVQAGLDAGRVYSSPIQWPTPDRDTPASVSNGLDERVHPKSQRYRRLDHNSADVVGQMLLTENVRSVNYRYSEQDVEDLYRFERPRHRWSPVEVLKAINCLEYQSCEHPEWEASEAHAFLEGLKGWQINALPGYNEAPWGIDEESVPSVVLAD